MSSISFFFKSLSTTTFGLVRTTFKEVLPVLRKFTSPKTVSLCSDFRIAQLSPLSC